MVFSSRAETVSAPTPMGETMEYVAFEPGIRVLGTSVQSVIEAVKDRPALREQLLQILKIETGKANAGLSFQKYTWYPFDVLMQTFKKIFTELGGKGLEKIGLEVVRNALLPPSITNVH